MISSNQKQNDARKFFLLTIACLLFRMIPFRVPNVEPLTAVLMPISSTYGRAAGVLFTIASVLLSDTLTATLGLHTFFTMGAFMVLAIWAGSYFENRKGSVRSYVGFAIIGTLFFDAATGLIIGPIFYGQPMSLALAGQIPFTALHLLGNVVFAATLSPAIDHFLIRKRKRFDLQPITSNLNPKII